jgi:DNA-binding transcriptional LysR family regulator
MELRDLRTFASVIELRGMTRAARRLHVVQSAVSQAVKRLEQEYGLQLLERRSDGVYPTAAGIEFARHAERIMGMVTRLEEDMASFRGHARGVVNVGIVSTLAAVLVSPLVRAFDRELVDVTLRVKEGVAGELLESLRLGRLDLVAVVSPVEVEDMAFVGTGGLDLHVVVPPEHPFADRESVSFAETADEPWVSFPLSNPARRWLEDNSRKAGFRPLVAAEIETFTQMKAFVEAGIGIALAPSEFVTQELELGLLAAVPCVEPSAVAGLGYAFDPDQERTPVIAARALLEEQLRELTSAIARS